MHVHANATTNLKQRLQIRHSVESCGQLARRYHVSKATIHIWKQRSVVEDRSCRPQTIRTALSEEEETFVLALRRWGLSLDDVTDISQSVLPHVRRSSVHRLFVRHGVHRREKPKEEKPGAFKEYPPGFLHIDCFYLPKLEGIARYCFVAVDRATRFVYLWVYKNKDKEAATDFLHRCLEIYPFKIEKILTDNGREFTLAGFKNRYGTKVTTVHPFEQLCQEKQIEHRRTKPYTPKTNGLVERTNGLIKSETVKRSTYPSATAMIEGLWHWWSIYNFHRKHRRIGKITPYQAVCDWYKKEPERFLKEPSHLLTYRSQSPGT